MKKKYFPLFFVIVAIIISVFCWDKIILSYEPNIQPYGEYSENSYNAHNDTLRYIFFIIFPLGIFFVSYLLFNKDSTIKITEVLFYKESSFNIEKDNLLERLFLILILLFILIEFLILDFSKYSGYLDHFHGGINITPSNNFLYTKKLWSSTYVDHGLFANFFGIIVWKLFKIQTIGSIKVFTLFLLFLNKILLVFLSKIISKNLLFNKNLKLLFFITLSLLLISLVSYEDQESSEFPSRAVLFLSFFLVFFNSIYKSNSFYLTDFFLGIFSIISMLWYMDIGAYINVMLLIVLIYFLIRNELKKCFTTASGIILGWLIFILLIPNYEFKEFLNNTLSIYSTFDYIAGVIYPTPFLSGDIRSTKALIFIIISGMLLIVVNFKKNIKMSYYNKTFLIFLFIASILAYKSGVLRSDSFHIKAASGFTLFLIYTTGLYFLFNFFINIESKKNYIILAMLPLLLFTFIIKDNLTNLKNLTTSISSINNLFFQKDDKFISENYQDLVQYYQNLSKQDNCVQIMSNETTLPYLLKKPTCTKFFLIWNSGPHQEEFIRKLKQTKPRIILYSSEKDPFPDAFLRIPNVMKYIDQNYFFHSKFKFWTFYKIN